jgi:Type II secretion system (T2SS), protein E, N-terminal domain/Type II/IV secretion system protein
VPQKQEKRNLCSILIECDIVSADQVNQALARQIETGRLIGETLVELGFTTEENIGWALARQLGIPYVDVQASAIDADVARRFDPAVLRRVRAVPLYGNLEEVAVAMADPTDTEAIAELGASVGSTLSLVIGCPGSIRHALDILFGHERVASADASAHTAGASSGASQPDVPSPADVVWDRTGLNFLLYQLHAAHEKRASEIHFIPMKEGLAVLYRTDQGLESQAIERPETSEYLRHRLALLGAPDLAAEHDLSTSGAAMIDVMGTPIHIGVCHCRTEQGVTTVLRLSPAASEAYELSTLGLSPIGEAEIRDFVEGPEGLVIVHGPPRSGGSTVLASLAALAARPQRRTLVIEPARVTPYPAGTTRVPASAGHADPGLWERLAIGLGADVVVLDGVLQGDAVADVLSGASIGRLVFARTDWLDGGKLLAYLSESRSGRAVLRDRPFAMIALPAVRREGSSVWVTPADAENQAGILACTILRDEDRDAMLQGRAS